MAIDLLPPSELPKTIIPREVPRSEEWRHIFGGQTNLDMIEGAIQSAEVGYMAELTDLEAEILKLDPHLAGLLAKRIGALEAADWDVTPAEGVGRTDKAWAEQIANTVNRVLRSIPFFGERIYDLGWATYQGRALLEVHWASGIHGLRIAPYALSWVHPRRLSFGPRRELRVVDASQSNGGFMARGLNVEDFPGKFVWWTPRLFCEYPEREGLGPRVLYWAFFKRFSWRMRMKLTELFGIPWRIVEVAKDAPANPESIKSAREEAERLGGENVAAFDRGVGLKVWAPPENSGALFKMTSDEVNAEMSKLIVGNTGTTDAVANRAESIIHRGEQDIIVQRDGNGCGARFAQQLVRFIVLTGYGPGAAHLVPKFQLRVQPPRDRKSELERVEKVLSFGVRVPESLVRETSGVRAPQPDEPFVQVSKSGGTDAFGNALPPGYQVVDPTKDPPEPGPGRGPGGGPTSPQGGPDGGGGEPPEPGAEGTPEGDGVAGQAAAAIKDLLGLERAYFAGAPMALKKGTPPPPKVGAAQPATGLHGSPEVLIEKGTKEGVRAVASWAEEMLDACNGASTAPQLYKRLERAAAGLDLEAFSRAVEKRMVVGLALGALDADWEAENDVVVKPPVFKVADAERGDDGLLLAAGVANFVALPFQDAIKIFRAQEVLPRRLFDRLSAEAKRRAFTVSGMGSRRMLQTAHEELARSLERGDDLRAFRASLEERFELAGWSAANPSHVEVVFRNAVMGSYSSGRDVQMRQPSVLAARPYWQVLGVNDARTRPTHRKALGKVLRADDAFWERSPVPWGHNCRCRKVSRSADAVRKLGLDVVTGTALSGLPDDGWDAPGSLFG